MRKLMFVISSKFLHFLGTTEKLLGQLTTECWSISHGRLGSCYIIIQPLPYLTSLDAICLLRCI